MDDTKKRALRSYAQQILLMLGDELPERTVRDLVAEYVERHRPRWRASTLRQYLSLQRFLGDHLGSVRLVELTLEHGLQLRQCEPLSTSGNATELLRRALAWGVRAGWCEGNVLDGLSRYSRGQRTRVLDSAELEALTDALVGLQGAAARAAELICRSGLSNRDARGLRWDEVSPPSTLLLPDRKHSGLRVVTVGDAAMAVVLARPVGVWVFPGQSGVGPVSGPTLSRVWSEACSVAGLVEVTPHTLRHTLATRAVEQGATMADLQRMFGWSGTSAHRYVHGNPERARQLANRMGPRGVSPRKRRSSAAG